jgi:hypothetical protein
MATPTARERIDYGEFDSETARLFFGTDPQDEIDWIESLLTIDNEQGQVVPFKLFPQQRAMAHNKTGRDLTVKGRQTRASSYILAKNVRRMVTGAGLKCLTMTQDDQTTNTFRARVRHHLRDLKQQGWEFKVGLDNDSELVLEDNECRWIWGSGEERTAGRAYSAHIAHLSEFAHWPLERANVLIGGITPSVPGPPYGWFDIESTPNGAEGTFYQMVSDSKTYDPMSRWTTHFYSWWMEPRYRAGTTPGCDVPYSEDEWEHLLRTFTPTDEEERLMAEAELDVGKIIWRRVRKAEQDKTDAPFLQEYVETLEGCFLMAGGNYFASQDGINHLDKFRDTVSPPKEIVTQLPGSSVVFPMPHLHVWQRPQMGRPYAVWVDCAGGGLDEASDYSTVVVLDAAEMFVAARLAVKVAPQELAPMAVAIAKFYNNALLGGERDAFGSVCVAKVQEIGYRNLWFFLEPGKSMSIKTPILDPWGHPTQIRQHILTALREHVFAGTFHTSDAWGVQQMGAFTWAKVAQKRHGLKEVGKGQKDDIVMCYAGLCYIADQARARYTAKQRVSTGGPIRENEVVTVGRHGLVLDRSPVGARPRPWLR